MDAERHFTVDRHALFVRSSGELDAAPVLCIPSLSATSLSFAAVADALVATGRRVLAVDLRGRGHSAPAAPYGLLAHARDLAGVLAIDVDAHGVECREVIGHGFGALVALALASLIALERLVLIDAVATLPAAERRGLDRLGPVHCSVAAYSAAAGHDGAVWLAHDRDELDVVPGGFRARTSREACFEDMSLAMRHDAREFLRCAPERTLVIRSVDGGVDDREVTGLVSRTIDTPPTSILTNPAALAAIAEHLS